MRSTAKRTVLGVAVLGMTAIVVPTASATTGLQPGTTVRIGQGPLADSNSANDAIHGGCFLVSTEDPTIWGYNEGVIGTASVTNDSSVSPTGATVTCFIKVNGAPQPGHSFTGSNGVQVGADRTAYQATVYDTVELCQDVTYNDGTSNPQRCSEVVTEQIPPPVVYDLVESDFFPAVDPIVCPILQSQTGEYGPITIAYDGDVYAADPLGLGINPAYDCPPYGNF